jgi:hypothetical protein
MGYEDGTRAKSWDVSGTRVQISDLMDKGDSRIIDSRRYPTTARKRSMEITRLPLMLGSVSTENDTTAATPIRIVSNQTNHILSSRQLISPETGLVSPDQKFGCSSILPNNESNSNHVNSALPSRQFRKAILRDRDIFFRNGQGILLDPFKPDAGKFSLAFRPKSKYKDSEVTATSV